MKVLTAVAGAFLKDKHGLFLMVEGKQYIIHNLDSKIMIDDASDFENFKHGLHIALKETKEGEIEAEKPKKDKVIFTTKAFKP